MSDLQTLEAMVEAMRNDPFCDDAHALGTTAMDMRMEHYASVAFNAVTLAGDAEIPRMMRALRKRVGLSQEAFADQVGLTRFLVTAVETGKRALTVRNCCLISKAFPDEQPLAWAYAAARDAVHHFSDRKR